MTLEDLSAKGTVVSDQDYGVARFATYLLGQKYGTRSLFDYFAALGRGDRNEQAFQSQFDMSLSAFDAEFEALCRDYEAARWWGREEP